MVINYYGTEFFKISFGDTTLAVNPVSKESKEKGSKFGADIALVTFNHPDFNGTDQVAHGERVPFIVSGAGEYEIRRVFIRGFPTTSSYGGSEGINTIYTIELEGMNLCFLGALSESKLESNVKEALRDIDVLFVPVSGGELLEPSAAHTLSVQLEAKLVIPMHYDKATLNKFLKEEGSEKIKPLDKLTVKKRDLEGKQGEIVVLAS